MELALHPSQIRDGFYSVAQQISSVTVTLGRKPPESVPHNTNWTCPSLGTAVPTSQHVTPYRILLYVDILCLGLLEQWGLEGETSTGFHSLWLTDGGVDLTQLRQNTLQ